MNKLVLGQGTIKTKYHDPSKPRGFLNALTMDVNKNVKPDIVGNISSPYLKTYKKFNKIYAKFLPIVLLFHIDVPDRKKHDIMPIEQTWKNIYKLLKNGGTFTLNNFNLYINHQKVLRGMTYAEHLVHKINSIRGIKFSVVISDKKTITLVKQ